MRTTKKAYKTYIALAAAATLFAACSKNESRSAIKVGILHSMTGAMAHSEIPVIEAERMAVEEINKSGGVLGRQIEIVLEDGESNPDVFAKKARKLLTEDKVRTIFGCWTSASRKAVLPVLEDEDIFGLLWYPLQYEGLEASPNIMYMGAAPNQQAVPAVEYCEAEFGDRMFIIGSDYIFPRTVGKTARRFMEYLGGECAGEYYVDMDCDDFSGIIEQIQESKPDWILNALNGESNKAFFRQLNEADILAGEIPVMSLSVSESEINYIGAAYLEGHYVVWNYLQSVQSAQNQSFIERYKNFSGPGKAIGDPMEAGYMAVYLWAAACEKAGSFDVEDVRIASKGMNVDAPEGTVTVDGENQHLYKKVRVGRINAGGLIDEIWESERAVKPDPYLSTYIWAKGL